MAKLAATLTAIKLLLPKAVLSCINCTVKGIKIGELAIMQRWVCRELG